MNTKYGRYMAAALIWAVSCLLFLSGCGKADKKEAELPDVFPLEMEFSSGAGAWRTSITLNRDGSFEGQHSDADAGDRGDSYPHGTVYLCDFSGQFENIEKVDDHTYSMTLKEITAEKAEGETWIEDEIKYIASEPYGLDGGKEFLFYTPQTPLSGLSEDLLSWWPGWYYSNDSGNSLETLSCYGLYNKEMGYGFFTYE